MKQIQKRKDTITANSYVSPSPQAEEAEKAVIGALLVESTAIHEVYNVLDESYFYDHKLGEIYAAVRILWETGKKPDMVGVMEELKHRGSLESVGGPYALSVLSGNVGSASNIRQHAEYIHQSHLQRQLMTAAQYVMQDAADPTLDVSDSISAALRRMEELSAAMEYGGGAEHISNAVKKALEAYTERERMKSEGRSTGITTGLKTLDKYICGLQPKQLVIIGARPAMGKTALALHMARSAAMSGVPVAFFALEMDAVKLADRVILSRGAINPACYRGGMLSNTEKTRLYQNADEAERLPIYVDDSPYLNIRQIKARSVNLQRKGKCGIIFIDYLGLLNMTTTNNQYGREQEVSQTSRQAKMMAKELGVPVVLLSQLNRNIEGKISGTKSGSASDFCPGLSDLRESGAIEQDADVVLMIHRPEYYDHNAPKGVGIINIAKQREGRTGKVKFGYNDSMTNFFDPEEQTGAELFSNPF